MLERLPAILRNLQKGVLVEHLLDFLAQFEGRQLQQPDRLLQLRRQGQVLGDAKLQSGFHGNRSYILKFSPR